jgi:hypothetical protein
MGLPEIGVARAASHSSSMSSRNRIAPPGNRIAGSVPARVHRRTVSVLTPSCVGGGQLLSDVR